MNGKKRKSMKEKIVEILKEFSTVEDDEGLTCHTLSGFFFYTIASRIDTLYLENYEKRIERLDRGIGAHSPIVDNTTTPPKK